MSESNRRKKVLNLSRSFLENENQKELNIALNIGEFKGPICDFIGFSQHKGECWNDTLQEIFLFADGLKEVTQSLIYNLDTRYDVLSKLVSSRLYPESELNTEKLNTVNKLVKYITLMKVRFVTHYNFLTVARNETKKHLWKKLYTKKRRLSTLCGIGSAKHIINLSRGNSNIYEPGLSATQRNELFLNLIRIFDIGFVVTDYRETDSVSKSNAFIISANFMKLVDKNTYKRDGSHAFGFLKCDSVWRVYDDNRDRFIKINELLIDVFLKENNVALGVDADDAIFIMKYESSGETVTIREYYDIDEKSWNKWSNEWDALHNFKVIFTKNSASTVRPRLRWGNMKRGVTRGGSKRDCKCDKTRKKLKCYL